MQGVYRATSSPAQHALRMGEWGRGRGVDVGKVGGLVEELVGCGVLPVRVAVGRAAVEAVRESGRGRLEEIEEWVVWREESEGEEDEDEMVGAVVMSA